MFCVFFCTCSSSDIHLFSLHSDGKLVKCCDAAVSLLNPVWNCSLDVSALEWVLDQYRVKVDKNRSEIVNDVNDVENPRYIVELIGRVITVSLETVRVVEGLPPLV